MGRWGRRLAAMGFAALVAGALVAVGAAGAADHSGPAKVAKQTTHGTIDRHVGYYYPKPGQIETYRSRARTRQQADRRMRIGFVVAVVTGMGENPFPPTASFFSKGDDASKLIIVSNRPGRLNTIYRVRAFLATLTANARATPMFHDMRVEDSFTFLDLLKLLGFKQVTVSDGDSFAHQIKLL